MTKGSGTVSLHLHYWGQADNPPVLMLHGHPGSGECMTVFAEALQDRFWVIAPDLRGYGQSRTSTPFVMEDHLTDLERVLHHLNIDRFLVLGWSLGGILALELALRYPHRVQGIILVASAARPVGDHPPVSVWDEINTGIASVLNWIWPGWPWIIDTWGRHSLYRYLIQRHTPATYQYLARFALPAYLRTSPHARQALRASLRQGYNRVEVIRHLPIPALVCSGQQDRHITCQASQETAQALAATWISYADTAHLFPWEIPEQVQQDLRSWLMDQDGLGAY